MARATISDVASLAGVSIATVSHVINNTRFVSAETRKKVEAAIASLNYNPLASARSLAKMETRLVGVVLPDMYNPFFIEMYKGIEATLTSLGYDLILTNTGEDLARQEAILKALYGRQVDGLIVAPCGGISSKMLINLEQEGIPVALVDRISLNSGYPKVMVNNEQAAFDAVSHLIRDGHDRIALIGGMERVSPVMERKVGYMRALDEHGIQAKKEWIIFRGKSLQDDAYNSTLAIFSKKKPPTAIFATNIPSALGVLHAFRKLKIRCPEDVGLLSFDDHNWTDIFSPPISVVRQPAFKLGESASDLLIGMINRKEGFQAMQDVILDCSLIIRGSCSSVCLQSYMEKNSLEAALG
jgi:LacI family transcriptional regulator